MEFLDEIWCYTLMIGYFILDDENKSFSQISAFKPYSVLNENDSSDDESILKLSDSILEIIGCHLEVSCVQVNTSVKLVWNFSSVY